MRGFLFFADALGIAQLMHRDWRLADAALASIARAAGNAANARGPGGRLPSGATPGARVVVFNDSVFFFSQDLQASLQYASVLALQLALVPPEKGGPIFVRGAIAASDAAPRVVARSPAAPCMATATRLAADRVSAALIAEKTKVLGPRLLVEAAVLPKEFAGWSPRTTAKLMNINSIPAAMKADTLALAADARSYVDLNWMVVEEDKTLSAISHAIDRLQRTVGFSSRAAVHAAAARALHELAIARRNGVCVILEKLYRAGLRKNHRPDRVSRRRFADWLASIQDIESLLGHTVSLPLEMGNLRELPRSMAGLVGHRRS